MIRFEEVLNSFRKIFCECQYCGHIFRLSDTEIQTEEKPNKDWLAKIDAQIERLENQIQKAEERYELKRYAIVEKERKKIERNTFRKIHKVLPNFSKIKFNTRDLKTIGYPVKFISFDGKFEKCVEHVRLIDYHPETTSQERLLSSIGKTIHKGNVEWKTLRITDNCEIEEES